MLDSQKKKRLSDMLATHGEVVSISQFPDHADSGKTLVLATMRSPHDAARAQFALGLPLFGYNALIINAQWLATHLAD